MALHQHFGHFKPMKERDLLDPFLAKLKQVIDDDPNLTVSNIAVKAGLTNSVVRKWYSEGKSPRLDSMRRVCEALGTTLEVFLSDATTEEEKEIVRLVARLPDHLRRQLLGYGQGLLAAEDQAHQAPDEAKR